MTSWEKFNPVFECENANTPKSAWLGHRKFAYDLVRNLQPKTFVELGTHYGASFFSMCQAVKDGGIDAKGYAVDTWTGDPHSGGFGSAVYEEVHSIADGFYPEIAVLLRKTFDEALHEFEKGSINLLHIDGYHTYEAVKHDFDTWLPKLADNGVILLHDIMVRHSNFGVYRLWEELKAQYPAAQFEHWHGLGVVMPKGVDKRLFSLLTHWEENKGNYIS